ncbi:HAD-IB family phosphatase [Oscillatoriales cyanobacterium LEGE 11467]|uniref:HAD-IB family phosphatase n=1 Tax=Zarconia navalis LEGE 11467 TaxID=1828826 RepID=A0A928Z5N2_9CYAN|nr:HAD-IB family phosphatase [Zarconia navalis]MBE9039487.1 HAD-IB family phosphatase [Zarconia navalis LEGE 11467]
MKRAVFCDFDGTITLHETFVAMLTRFAPERSAQLLPEIYALRMTLHEGVRRMMAAIPSRDYPAILEFTRTQPMRPGLVELLDFLDRQQVPFVVVSGGLRGMVEAVLGDLKSRTLAIHAADTDVSGEYLRVYSEFEGETEMVEKVRAIERYGVKDWVAIGDSVTDLNMAVAAPTIFARDRLCQYLNERQKPYIEFRDFFDVRDRLEQMWG